jgi:hypothetical protein
MHVFSNCWTERGAEGGLARPPPTACMRDDPIASSPPQRAYSFSDDLHGAAGRGLQGLLQVALGVLLRRYNVRSQLSYYARC